MANTFHGKPFDESTLLKLEIFRDYLREWWPVFLTQSQYWHVHVFDFFAGPGTDVAGNPGSPLIILDELEAFMRDRHDLASKAATVTVHFNDEEHDHIAALEKRVAGEPQRLCEVKLSEQDFIKAFQQNLPILRRPDTACLVLMDQCGMKYVNPEVFKSLIECPTTDILFFISSSTIRRFHDEPCIKDHLPFDPDQISRVDHREVHRYVCGCYRRMVPQGKDYFLAPFSIQKDNKANIYGVIFGSGSLLGLEKFLRVCWDKDRVTGEANYNIDADSIRDGQLSFFPEENVIKKQDRFEKDLTEFIKVGRRNNLEIYRFCLESGFLPRHGKELLQKLKDDGRIQTVDLKVRRTARKGAFYLSWEQYKTGQPRISIEYRG